MAKRLSAEDLAHTANYAGEAFQELANARLFLTGGTGFFGQWMLETLLHANRELGLSIQVTVLTRSPESFRRKGPHLASDPAIHLHAGDVRSFEFPARNYTHILHAAADSVVAEGAAADGELAESIIDGTRRVLEFAQICGAKRLLYVSSGAVYGRNVTVPMRIPETFSGAPDPLELNSSYEGAKRAAEQLCIASAEGTMLELVVARCFAFVGPHLPLDKHFAIGNFIRDAMEGNSIEIRGDGTPRRSWLYMADLAIWLWTLLVRGQSMRAYNVGSDEVYSIADAAKLVAQALRPDGMEGSTLPVHIQGISDPSIAVNGYVPSIERAQLELGLCVRVPLAEAVRRTASWNGFSHRRVGYDGSS
jgi:nucleoside-diphosphate-sugar epimerase